MATAGTIQINMQAGTAEFSRDMDKAGNILNKFTLNMEHGSRLSFDFFNGLNAVTDGLRTIIGVGASLVTSSADQREAIDLVSVQYGKSAGIITDAADVMADRFGTVKTDFLEGVGTLEGLVSSMGLAEDETANLSVRFGQLAVDMESAFNSSFCDELERIRSGLAGESEPLRRYGVDLSAAAVEQEALRSGIVETAKELDNAGKVQARAAIIFRDLSKITGNKALTQSSTANQIKEIEGRLTNLKADIGTAASAISDALIVTVGGALLDVTNGFDGLDDAVKQWADDSIKSGGLVNEGLGLIGDTIAQRLDYLSYVTDTVHGLSTGFHNLFTTIVTTAVSGVALVGDALDKLPGISIDTDALKAFNASLVDSNNEYLKTREGLFDGSELADSIREYTDKAQQNMDELGKAALTIQTDTSEALDANTLTEAMKLGGLANQALSQLNTATMGTAGGNAVGGKLRT